MKITTDEPDRLVVENKTWFGQLFGAIFMTVGACMALFIPTSGAFECDRARDECVIRGGSLVFSGDEYIPLKNLVNAGRAMETDSEGTTCQVRLQLRSGMRPISSVWSTCTQSQLDAVNSIKDFIQNERRHVLVDVGLGWWFWPFCGVFFFSGLAVFFFLGSAWRFVFADGTLEWWRRRPLSRGYVLTETLHLDAIQHAELDSQSDSDGTTYRVDLRLGGGSTRGLLSHYSSGYEDKQRVVEAINAFLQRASRRT